MKLVIFLILLIFIPAVVTESFSYFNGDMIDNKIKSENHIFSNESQIIKFNELSLHDQQAKRFLIFGKGSVSELGNTLHTSYSVSSSNGFFSIVVAPENIISIFESKGFHVIEDFQLDFHSKYIS